jgi:hypothetical protein
MKEIEVTNLVNADVEVVNHSPLTMMGKGRQGAVFQFSDEICVKVFGNTEDCEREHYALTLGQHTNLFPKVFAKGPLYIAMEIIKGVDLREYLQSHPLTEELSMKLINMLITFKEIGYERIDHHKRQIYLQPDGNLKVIDVARTVWRDRVYPYPRKLLTSFGEEYKELFLSHVQALSPELYEEWKHYIRMEEMSRQIYQVHLKNPSNKDQLKELSNTLLTTNDEQIYVTQLESLVQKVVKEEWVKTMLARGIDPDVVMEKIDKHWEKWEKKNVPNQANQSINKQKSQPDSPQKNKSTNKDSYIGYNDQKKSDLNKGNNGYQKVDSFPSHNRNYGNDKFKNWFNSNENSIKSNLQK